MNALVTARGSGALHSQTMLKESEGETPIEPAKSENPPFEVGTRGRGR